jgi:NAD(P)-dependent dehydrogenase (short-subunit alcohol dehydrogenase family)
VPESVRASLAGKVALVTGANRGIGAAFVDALVELGAARVYAGARDPGTLEDARSRHGSRLVPVRFDVTEASDVAAFAAAHDDVDLLVSNAGREGSGRILGHDEADARHLFEVHLWGPWRLADALAPGIQTRGGGMIFVQSIAALALSRRGPFYSASKAAATMMASAMRESLRDSGITVTNVFPGFTDTQMMATEDVPKARPRQTAERALEGWAAGRASVYPDRFARLIHDRLASDVDAVLDEPGRVVTEEYLRYVSDGDAT